MKFLLYRQTIIPAYNKFWRESHYHRMWVCKEEEEAEAEEVSDRKSTILMFPRKNSPPFEDHKTEEECALTPWWGGAAGDSTHTFIHRTIRTFVNTSIQPWGRTTNRAVPDKWGGDREAPPVRRAETARWKKWVFGGRTTQPSPRRQTAWQSGLGRHVQWVWVGVSLDGGGGEKDVDPSVRPFVRPTALLQRACVVVVHGGEGGSNCAAPHAPSMLTLLETAPSLKELAQPTVQRCLIFTPRF